jgi:hypothetical protein
MVLTLGQPVGQELHQAGQHHEGPPRRQGDGHPGWIPGTNAIKLFLLQLMLWDRIYNTSFSYYLVFG